MPIPDAESAYVPHEKLSDYLLNDQHPVGASKAKWFRSVGYDLANATVLEQDLLKVVKTSEDYVEKSSSFGTKYVVSSRISTPNGVDANVTTVWIVELVDKRPRLVTAYPGVMT